MSPWLYDFVIRSEYVNFARLIFSARNDVTLTAANQRRPCEFVAPPPPPGNPPSCDVRDDVTQVSLTRHDSLTSGK